MENTNLLESSELTAIIAKYSPFFKEIRNRFYFTLSIFGVAAMVGFTFHENIIKFFIEMLSLEGVNIVFTSPFQFINLALSCGTATGVIVILPLLIVQILSFLKPALRKKEYATLVRFVPFSIILFVTGFIFGALIMRWQIKIFLSQSIAIGIGNILDISGLITTILLTSALIGICFQFPIVLLLLMRIGIIKHQQLVKKRLWIYLGSFIFAMLLPSDSIMIDIILSLPLIILFELTLLLNYILEGKRTT